jgi:LacI family transcriptional regulator
MPVEKKTRTVVTLKDLAAATGYSVAAVSYALRGEGHLKAASREEILRKAAELGYRPNLHAARLRSQRKDQISAGYPIALLMWHTNGACYPIDPTTAVIRETAMDRGFQLEQAAFREPRELRPLLRSLFHRGVRGLVLSSLAELERWTDVDWSRFSIVTCGRWDTVPATHNVREDVFASVTMLARELAERGYRRVGAALCRHTTPLLDDLEREGAWAGWCARQDGLEKVPPFLGGHRDEAGFVEWARTWRPDAVIGFADSHYFLLKEAGFRVPRDLAYVSLQATARPGEIASLTDAHPPIGRASLSLLESLIRHNDSGLPVEPQTLLVRTRFAEGASLPEKARGIGNGDREGVARGRARA